MCKLNILLILCLSMIPTIISIYLNCYSNARLILPSSAILYNNFTLESCQCLSIQQNISAIQYDSNEKSCYTFGNDSSRANLRVKINSQVCFVNRTTTSYSGTTIVLPSPPISITTSITGNNYYQKESIYLTNTAPLMSLSVLITVPKTVGVHGPGSYTNFWANTVNTIINDTTISTMYIFQIATGQTIVAGQWEISVQFSLNGQVRSTSNDTYFIQIQSYQPISGHF